MNFLVVHTRLNLKASSGRFAAAREHVNRCDNVDLAERRAACQDADVTCCLIWSCVATVPMATRSSSQRAAASCRAEVCTGNVEQLSQLGPSTDTLHVSFTTRHAVSQFTLQRRHLVANAAWDLMKYCMPQLYCRSFDYFENSTNTQPPPLYRALAEIYNHLWLYCYLTRTDATIQSVYEVRRMTIHLIIIHRDSDIASLGLIVSCFLLTYQQW